MGLINSSEIHQSENLITTEKRRSRRLFNKLTEKNNENFNFQKPSPVLVRNELDKL